MMELKVSVHEKYNGASIQQSLSQSQKNICAISCENVIVFTRVFYRSNSFKQSIPVYTVYAADLNTPFESHVVTESLDQILQIKFNNDGHQLLIVTSSKRLQLYIKGAGLHEWTNTYTSTWSEEDILFVDFFHTKNEACIQINDIKVNALYAEKFQCVNHQPTLKSIGNCAQNGLFAITASGLFLACTLNSNGIMEEEERAILGPVRDNFNLASAAFSQSGHIHIAAWKSDIVKCWDVELGYIERERIASKDGTIFGGISINGNRKLRIKVLSTNFFSPKPLNTEEIKSISSHRVKVMHLKHTDYRDPKSLLLFIQVDKDEANTKDKTAEQQILSNGIKQEDSEKKEQKFILQLYQLQEKSRSLFQFFSSDKKNVATTVNEWMCQAEWKTSVPVVAINTPSQNLFPGSSTIPYLISLATSDDTIYVINKDSMQQISKYNLQSSRIEDHSSTKRNGKDKKIISITNTWTNLHLIVLDSTGGLHILSLLKQSDVGNTWLVYIMLLLEYTLVSGNDWCDILMAAPPTSALTLTDRLSETFHQHPLKVVTHLSSKFLVLKNSILRSSSNLHQRSIETRLQAQLSAILKLFHSLRPVTTDLITVEKNLYATIQTYIESRNSLEVTDIDKSIDNLLFSCNILDCQVDPTLSRDLQILLEFSTDLALYLLLLLVQNPKYELAKENKILQHLREILFIARLWYRHNKLVFPQMIKKTDAVDIWVQLYKLLTRLAQIIPGEPDAGFLDDCVILETQVLCREVPLFIPPRGIIGCTSTLPSASHYPMQFYFDQADPNPAVSSVNPRPLEGSLAAPQPLDPLYYHFLGVNEKLLQCTRCFALRGSWWSANDLTMWEQEWSNRCICSGHWAPSASQKTPKPA